MMGREEFADPWGRKETGEGTKRKEHALGLFGAIQAGLQTRQRFASVVGGEVRGRVQSSGSACPENPWAMQDLWSP